MGAEFHLRFAIVDVARDCLHAAPFLPFSLRLHDGVVLHVTNPDVLNVDRFGAITYDDGTLVRVLNPALIASVDRPSVPA